MIKIKHLNYEVLKPNDYNPKFVFDPEQVRELEANYQEAIEALQNYYNSITVCSALDNYVVRIIEKATGQSWKELTK